MSYGAPGEVARSMAVRVVMRVRVGMAVVVAFPRWMRVRVPVVVRGGQSGRDAVVTPTAPAQPGFGHPLGEDPGQCRSGHSRPRGRDLDTRYAGGLRELERRGKQGHPGGAEQSAAADPLGKVR